MYDKLGKLVNATVKRWTAKSPETYRIITDVAAFTTIGAMIILMIPATFPAWVVPSATLLVAIGSKLTKE
jgi:hypothetical protein